MQSAPEKLVRVKDDWLQLAFHILRKDQRDLALLATIDFGPQDYFNRIVQLIKKREKRGFAIVYEDHQDLPGLTQEREGSEPIELLKQNAMASLQKHGIAYLADVVRPEDYWTKVSTPALEIGSDELGAVRDELTQRLRKIHSEP